MFRKTTSVFRRLFSGRMLLLTNTISSGGLLALGDGIQQSVERRRGLKINHDWSRSGRMLVVGLSQGPIHHYWYLWLYKYIPKNKVFYKILADQIIAAPFFAVTFFLGMGILEGKTVPDAFQEFKTKFPAVYAFDWVIWPPSQYVNFMYVPARFQVLYVNCVTVVWDVFLSYMKHYDQLTALSMKQS